MTKFILASLFSILLFSCSSKTDNDSSTESKGEKAEKDKKVSKRDLSITPANAYNNLFLDSAALVSYLSEHKVSDSVSRRMRSFYNARNYQYAWFSPDGLTEQARGFWNMLSYHTAYENDSSLFDKQLDNYMENAIGEENLTISTSNKNALQAEFKLTEHFILYALTKIEDGYIKRKEMERFVPRKKEDALYLADSLITKKHKDEKYYEDVNEAYGKLKEQLKVYYTIAKSGGWPMITSNAKQFKKRIILT